MDLLERGPQLAALVEYAEDAARGRARLVLVAGEAGAGKTALVEALRGQVPEARWLVGACDGLFTPRPLGPLLDVAEQTGGELAALCERTDVPRAQLFRALVRDLTTHEGATVLVVEDVHWADRATLDLVHHLSRGIDGARLLVVLTYRDDPADVPPDLTRLLGDLVRQGSTRHVTVPPLTREAVATLTARSGIGPDELLRLTGGNPFFLTEVLAVATDQIPSTARSAVLSRVVGLGPGARRALEEVALLGVRVELEVARAVTGLTPQELDELVANGVLRADDEVVAFRHEIARRAIADTVPEHRLADVHRRALSVLEEAGCTDHARLAHHADGAGDSALVLVHAPLAARAAARLGAHRQAVEHDERAVRHADGAGPRRQAELLVQLLDELGVTDRWSEALEAGERALALWEQLDDPVGTATTLRRTAAAYWRLGRGRESREAGRRAVALLEPLGPSPELGEALGALAGRLMVGGENAEAVRVARRARELAVRFDLPGVQADTDNTEACAHANEGQEWLPLLTRSLRLARRHGLHTEAGRAWTNLVTMHQVELRLEEALSVAAEGLAYTAEHGVGTWARCLRGARAEALEQLGRWDEAVHEGEALLAEPASPENRLQPSLVIGRIRLRRANPGAGPPLEEALATARGSGDPQFVVPAALAMAESAWTDGDVAAARSHLGLARAVASGVDPLTRGQLLTWESRLGVPTDQDGVAEAYAVQVADPRAAARSWQRLGCPFPAALALVDAGDEASLREALQLLDGLGAVATARRVRRLMREAGIRAVPAGARAATRANPFGLTPREQEVLDHVVAGLGNAEIAAALFVTPKTVEHHVSHVLAKLGAADRREAAALVTAADGGRARPSA